MVSARSKSRGAHAVLRDALLVFRLAGHLAGLTATAVFVLDGVTLGRAALLCARVGADLALRRGAGGGRGERSPIRASRTRRPDSLGKLPLFGTGSPTRLYVCNQCRRFGSAGRWQSGARPAASGSDSGSSKTEWGLRCRIRRDFTRGHQIKFGLVYEICRPEPFDGFSSESDAYWQALEQICLADELGFEHVWEVEHHFLEGYSISSAPEVFLSAVAQNTKSIRVGNGVRLLPPPFNHPARSAEMAAVWTS